MGGSHHLDGRAGIGITLAYVSAPPLLQATIPVQASYATRVEALKPPLQALLLTGLLNPGPVFFHGDSALVVHLLDRATDPADLHLLNCIALARDLLPSWPHSATWHPRSENTTCDALAREAAFTGMVRLAEGDFPRRKNHMAHWIQLRMEFAKRFCH